MLCEYAAVEIESRERIVCANEQFVAVVPFWATWPFETLVLPRTHVAALSRQTRVMADMIVNHMSDRSPQFLDFFEHGSDSVGS